MGTAPDDRQSTPLSDPEQVVTDTAAEMVRLGYPLTVALTMIADVMTRSAIDAACGGRGDVSWLLAVSESARNRVGSLTPSSDTHTGDDHADGTGSRPGGPA